MVRLLVFFLCAIAFAQEPCQVPPEIRGLTLEQIRARVNSGENDFFLYKQLLDLTPSVPKPGTLAVEFERRLKPDDGVLSYLYGRALIGKNTPEAIVHLNRATELSPSLPWTYLALQEVYASRNFADKAKLLDNMRSYHNLCPANTDGFRYLDKLTDGAEAVGWVRDLRPLLEASPGEEQGRYWRLLWAAEFRLTPQAEYDALRAKVAGDVKRLEALPNAGDRTLMGALADGYKLSGQMDAAGRIEHQLNPDEGFNKNYDAWMVKSGLRGGNLTAEERQAAFREYAKISVEWTAKWPDDPAAWSVRLLALTGDPNWKKEDLEQVGEQYLKVEAPHRVGWTYTPGALRVTQLWFRYGIRIPDCVTMAERALDEIARGPMEYSDLTAPPNAADIVKRSQFGFDVSLWDAMDVIAGGAAQLKDFEKARRMLARMQRWLDENQFKKDDASAGFTRFQASYLVAAGRVAEAEGHKVDATALYTKAAATGFIDGEVRKHARALWDEQGGTREGWSLATRRLPAPKPPNLLPVDIATTYAAWTKVDMPLPDAGLRDAAGKPWALTNLKGKLTLVNVWATWCVPCREELPQIQKLYELSRQRGDFEVVTFSIDENPGELEPFMKSKGYTFPVVLARQYLENVAAPVTIPQNWVVDGKATLREKSIGFDSRIVDWAAQTAARVIRAGN
ncbi:MAG: Redoxin domain protein [Candidatus Solibacter sp.]|nr:Redoxin domain protein [Candidatus Solibacter sp.]